MDSSSSRLIEVKLLVALERERERERERENQWNIKSLAAYRPPEIFGPVALTIWSDRWGRTGGVGPVIGPVA